MRAGRVFRYDGIKGTPRAEALECRRVLGGSGWYVPVVIGDTVSEWDRLTFVSHERESISLEIDVWRYPTQRKNGGHAKESGNG